MLSNQPNKLPTNWLMNYFLRCYFLSLSLSLRSFALTRWFTFAHIWWFCWYCCSFCPCHRHFWHLLCKCVCACVYITQFSFWLKLLVRGARFTIHNSLRKYAIYITALRLLWFFSFVFLFAHSLFSSFIRTFAKHFPYMSHAEHQENAEKKERNGKYAIRVF